jgi:hypothetical protein
MSALTARAAIFRHCLAVTPFVSAGRSYLHTNGVQTQRGAYGPDRAGVVGEHLYFRSLNARNGHKQILSRLAESGTQTI